MDSLSELFLKARTTIQNILRSEDETQSGNQLGITASVFSLELVAPDSCAVETEAVVGSIVPASTTTWEAAEPKSEGEHAYPSEEGATDTACPNTGPESVVSVCSSGPTLSLVLTALETYEKPPLSFALGVLGWDFEQNPSIRDNPTELVDKQLVDTGRQHLATQVVALVRQVLEQRTPSEPMLSLPQKQLCFRLDLPLGSLRFTYRESLDWEKFCQMMPLDKRVQWKYLREEKYGRESPRHGDHVPSQPEQNGETRANNSVVGNHGDRSPQITSGTSELTGIRTHAQDAFVSMAPVMTRRAASPSAKDEQPGRNGTKSIPEASRKRGRPITPASSSEFVPTPERVQSRRVRNSSRSSGAGAETWQATMYALLDELLRDVRWEPFWLPVSETEAPAYYEQIQQPMDLSTLKQRLEAGHYDKLDRFIADANLIWLNAMDYNRTKSPVWNAAKNLRRLLESSFVAANGIQPPADSRMRRQAGFSSTPQPGATSRSRRSRDNTDDAAPPGTTTRPRKQGKRSTERSAQLRSRRGADETETDDKAQTEAVDEAHPAASKMTTLMHRTQRKRSAMTTQPEQLVKKTRRGRPRREH
ncbi:hypothetical protein CCYA_CCYA06G1772 [Cyanidiococcus yangmingshanensis]|nr:hypothetical protein CCYA_CCYA06G1772 [Cyanidiococcus yangmingshanensis]